MIGFFTKFPIKFSPFLSSVLGILVAIFYVILSGRLSTFGFHTRVPILPQNTNDLNTRTSPAPLVNSDFNTSALLQYDGLVKYCEIQSNASRLQDLLKLNASAMLQGEKWIVRPFSFTRLANHTLGSRNHIVVVYIESLRFKEVITKFPQTFLQMKKMQESNYIKSVLNIVRAGGNSPPNRGAFLLGLNSAPQDVSMTPQEARLGTRSLMSVAKGYVYNISISDTANADSCSQYHGSICLKLMVGDCRPFQAAYATVLKNASCTEPFLHDNTCPRFPYPEPELAYNCSHVSMHDLMIAQVVESLKTSERHFALMNFGDYHPPALTYVSINLDEAIARVLRYIEESSRKFTFLLLGDHGHGVNGDNGNAGGFFIASKPVSDSLTEVITQKYVTHLDLNRVLRRQMGGVCAEREVPSGFCYHCSSSEIFSSDWHVRIRVNNTEFAVNSASVSPAILAHPQFGNFYASLVNPHTCRDLDNVYLGSGFTMNLTVSLQGICSESVGLDFTWTSLLANEKKIATVGASTEYAPFQECANVSISATILDGPRTVACVSVSPEGGSGTAPPVTAQCPQ